jgi:hypothetical protein
MSDSYFFNRQPVTKNTFRQYRVLGKGGFGEVSGHPGSLLEVPRLCFPFLSLLDWPEVSSKPGFPREVAVLCGPLGGKEGGQGA